MRVIGLSGYARSGKDTVADILVNEFGYKRVTFAAKLKQAVAVLDPLLSAVTWGEAFPEWELEAFLDKTPTVRLSEAMESHTPEQLKDEFPEYRGLLQRMGTEVGRNLFGENFWVDIAFKDLNEDGKYVITDARFPNEAEAVKGRGGELWRITRPGYGPVNNHPSETSLDEYDFDAKLLNDSTLEVLHRQVAFHAVCYEAV